MSKNRDRLIALMDIFRDSYYADREISMQEIINHLQFRGIKADRRTIYSDIDLLNEIWDYKINRTYKKYIVTRDNSLNEEEVQIITDALLSARFISRENTVDLIKKLYNTIGYKMERGTLNKIRVEERVKFTNKAVKENILTIGKAIKKNRKIRFDYWKYSMHLDPELVRRDCLASPYGIAWYEDFYYMLGNYEGRRLSYYRIDRMKNVVITSEPRKSIYDVTGRHDQLNIGETLSKLVAPASGDEIVMTIKVDKKYLGKIRDKFGDRIKIRGEKGGEAIIEISVINNKELIPWILSFREGAEVVDPMDLRERVISVIDKMRERYE